MTEIEFDGGGPILVFGGPYSNLRATEALKATATRLGIAPASVICTGDIVAYCAEPEATAQAIADWGCHAIQGNCEQQLATGADDCACNFEPGGACDLLAKGWYPFAAERISPGMRTWMGALPESLQFNVAGLSFRVLHGGATEIARWVFASDTDEIAEQCRRAGTDVVIAGHCGMPFMSRAGRRTWFNAGVIGMPANDGSPEVWYGLITPTDRGVHLSTHRLLYDHQGAAASMRRSGHANGYARTLVTGLWPSLDILPEAERAAAGVRIRPRTVRIDAPRTMACGRMAGSAA